MVMRGKINTKGNQNSTVLKAASTTVTSEQGFDSGRRLLNRS
jgi:hypothetical protein